MKRPWGSYKVLQTGDGFLVKTITVKPKQAISLQKHKHRDEIWTVVKGTGWIEYGKLEFYMKPQETVKILRGFKHRITNESGDVDLVLVEIQFGDILDENDIERFEDLYGRIK